MARHPPRKRPGKLYCEAFPMLDISEMRRMVADERRSIEWSDEDGAVIGNSFVRLLDDDRLEFHYRFFGTANVEQKIGLVETAIAGTRLNENWTKKSIVCPQCARKSPRIYYVRGSWKCKSCHGLVGIAQRLGKIDRLMTKCDQLRTRLISVRVTRRNEAKIALERRHLNAMARFIYDSGVKELPEQLRFRLICTWLEPCGIPANSYNRDDVCYGWQPGDRIALRSLYPELELARERCYRQMEEGTIAGYAKPELQGAPKERRACGVMFAASCLASAAALSWISPVSSLRWGSSSASFCSQISQPQRDQLAIRVERFAVTQRQSPACSPRLGEQDQR